jgi:hypothetical protein
VVLVRKKGESGYEFYDPNWDSVYKTDCPGGMFFTSCMQNYEKIKPLQMGVCGEMVFDISSSKEVCLPHEQMPDIPEGEMISEFNKDVEGIHLKKIKKKKIKMKQFCGAIDTGRHIHSHKKPGSRSRRWAGRSPKRKFRNGVIKRMTRVCSNW